MALRTPGLLNALASRFTRRNLLTRVVPLATAGTAVGALGIFTNPTQAQAAMKMGVGSTPRGLNWVDYKDASGRLIGVYIDVDTSAAGFSKTPIYVSSIGGDSNHWKTTGSSAIYQATATRFRIYIRYASPADGNPPDSGSAHDYGWYINWMGCEM
jgi:hypothetical protein